MEWTRENESQAAAQGWRLVTAGLKPGVFKVEGSDQFASDNAAEVFVAEQARQGDNLASKALALGNLPVPDVALATVMADVGAELLDLLEQVDRTALEQFDGRGVLTATVKYLPRLVSTLKEGPENYVHLLPRRYVPVPCPPAGWATALDLVTKCRFAADSTQPASPDAPVSAETRGAQFATESVLARCPARGPGGGEEPVTLQAARKAYLLAMLLTQVPMPADDAPYGGWLGLMKCVMEATARNLGSGLYLRTGVLPGVANPAYLPPEDWKAILADIRHEALASCPEIDTDREQYQYFEGVRWTLSRFRDMFRDLSEPAAWPRVA